MRPAKNSEQPPKKNSEETDLKKSQADYFFGIRSGIEFPHPDFGTW